MIPILSFVGNSESGKTTLLEGVIANLKLKGYRIAVVKHTHDFELEKEGKNSWRFNKAGADIVAVTSPEELAILKKTDHDYSPQEIARLIPGNLDIVLTEGFKLSNTPKIEVHRSEQGEDLVIPPNHLLAVVTDKPLNVKIPQFDHGDVNGISEFIEKWLLEQTKEDVDLVVNGSLVPLNMFVKNFLIRTLIGMVSSLKGTGEVRSLQVSLRRKP